MYSIIVILQYILHITLQEGKGYAEDNKLLFMETSAKTATNVSEVFLAIGQ